MNTMVTRMFKRNKIKVKVEFNIETGEMKLVFRPKETRPSKVLLVLAEAQEMLDEIIKEEAEKSGEKTNYIS